MKRYIQNCRTRAQAGVYTVEFAVVGSVIFLLIFGVIEFGRLLYTLNVLDEATRRGARLAAVCSPADEAGVRNRAAFEGNLISELDAADLVIDYLDSTGTDTGVKGLAEGSSAYNSAFTRIHYVRAAVSNYQHTLLIPFLDLTVTAPDYATTIPAESLGVHPDGSSPEC